MSQFKPMKPPQGVLDLSTVKFPVYASIKYDGFRLAIKDGKTVLNSLRELDNLHVRRILEDCEELEGHDGELVMLPLNDGRCFNRCQSAFRAADGEPAFRFVVFDRVTDETFEERWVKFEKPTYPDFVVVDTPTLINNADELNEYIESVLSDNHEGVILRQAQSRYKFGRATFKAQELLRVKPMETAEGVIAGFECEYENTNTQSKNNLGYSKRSSAKGGKVAKDTLGKLICITDRWGEVRISGFTDEFADEVWANREKYLGEIITFSYQEIGSLEQPRLAKFKGLRAASDMG